jgi:hypothetical protein
MPHPRSGQTSHDPRYAELYVPCTSVRHCFGTKTGGDAQSRRERGLLESHAAPRLAAACGRLDLDGEPGRGGDERHGHVDQRAAAPKFQTITSTLASRRWNIAGDGSHEHLERRLLRLYARALAERHWHVAEHLLRALEDMAKSEPARQATVQQAYQCIAQESARDDLISNQPQPHE